jgi:predicted transcriptional regulator
MVRSNIPKPTDAELAILRVLWDRGASTVRQIHDVIVKDRAVTYTTTLKFIQIMLEKGLVSRQEQGRIHVYRAKHSEERMQRRLVGELLQRAFRGSATRMLMQALASKPASAAELKELQRLLDSYKKPKGE